MSDSPLLLGSPEDPTVIHSKDGVRHFERGQRVADFGYPE